MNHNNSVQNQRTRLLAYLRRNKGGATTIAIRRRLDILCPNARIYELRHRYGHNIVTIHDVVETQPGKPHKVARYVLLPGNHTGKEPSRNI